MADYDTKGLVAAWRFDGTGGAARVGWPELDGGGPTETGFDWIHLQLFEGRAQPWLGTAAGLDPTIVEALCADEPRPRCALTDTGALLTLRGVNLKPYSLPDEMLSLSLWVEEKRIVSVRKRPLSAIVDFEEALARNRAPRTPGEFVADLSVRLVDRLDTVVTALAEEADDLEETVFQLSTANIGKRIADLRRIAIKMRRTIAPQREALLHFSHEDAAWLVSRDQLRLREASDRITRFAEELDTVRERAAVIHDQLVERRAEQMNRSMLTLAMVTVLFAPLTLFSGMMGMNVGGVPWGDNDNGFWIAALVIAAGAGMTVWALRRTKWL